MEKIRELHFLAFLVVVILLTAGYMLGISGVPFHPDESTRLYTSGDAELFWEQPSSLFWRAGQEQDPRQIYRLLDSPLPNSLIAIVRWIAGQAPLARDWDWGKTWQENEQLGAVPSGSLLLAGRIASAMFFPLSLVFFFLAIRRVANPFTAWIGALLLASNALVLLHTRRSMAEGILLFTAVLALWSLVTIEKERWLISIPAALAFCAKQSLAPFIPLGLAAALFPVNEKTTGPWRRWGKNALLFGIISLVVVLLLHPFLWGQPVQAFKAAVNARKALAAAQTADRPDQALVTPERKLVSMISMVYLTPPIFAETGNYAEETRSVEQSYLANPLHSLFRSIPAGGLLLVLSLFGFLSAVLRVFKGTPARRGLVLFLSATILQTLALYVLIPLPWQRYYLPLVPYACLWTAFGIDQLRQAGESFIDGKRRMSRFPSTK